MAMAWIWTGMVAASVVFGLVNGTIGAVGGAAMEGAGAAVELCLSMAGIMCLWNGVMAVMKASGMMDGLSRLFRPALCRLLPQACRDPDALDCLERFTKEIAVQIFNLQTVLDVERFAIGGGISAQPAFLQAIRDQLQALYRRCPYTVPQAEVVACAFQNDANLIGALQCFFRAYP